LPSLFASCAAGGAPRDDAPVRTQGPASWGELVDRHPLPRLGVPDVLEDVLPVVGVLQVEEADQAPAPEVEARAELRGVRHHRETPHQGYREMARCMAEGGKR
jgi:hypothetical protein